MIICENNSVAVLGQSINTTDWEGRSLTLYFSGCIHQCDGCHNSESAHSVLREEGGVVCCDEKFLLHNSVILETLKREKCDNLVLSGGDPLFYKNMKMVESLVTEIKTNLPNVNIVLFTGYTIESLYSGKIILPNNIDENIANMRVVRILSLCDYLVDGKYDKTKKVTVDDRKTENLFFGSHNQRMINLNKTKISDVFNGNIVLYQKPIKSAETLIKPLSIVGISRKSQKPKNPTPKKLLISGMAKENEEMLEEILMKDKKNIPQAILKINEEIGEVSEALICAIGTEGCEYKKKDYNDVEDELLDVLVTTISALNKVNRETGSAPKELQQKINKALSKWNSKV